MRIHRNTRLTFAQRLELIHLKAKHGLTPSAPTARKWLGRYLAERLEGFEDRSSCPTGSPNALAPQFAITIVELRRRRLTQAKIAAYQGLSKSTVQYVLARAGLARWSDPVPPVVRYEHAAPGDPIHTDTK